uniref:serine protease FAM111A-like n=1 Tax=Pristiophorus japonicus TaxID=55135 RepID=UPI00398F6E19
MSFKQPRKSKTPSRNGQKDIRTFMKEIDPNQPATPVRLQTPCTEKRKPLRASKASRDADKVPEAPNVKVTEHGEADREKEFTFSFQGQSTEHVARGAPDENILSALKSSEAFQKAQVKYEGKVWHFIGKRELTGDVNLGMPCKCLPEKAHFEVIFYQNSGKLWYRSDVSSGKKWVIFSVRSTGKSGGRLGTGVRLIIKSESLRGNRSDLCIFAFEGETIQEALCMDGRFLPILDDHMWNLVDGQRSLQSTLTVDDLDGQSFEVEVQEKKHKTGNKASAADPSKDNQKRDVAGEGNKLFRQLKEQMDEYLGKERDGEECRKKWRFDKENFGKITSDAVPVRVHEMLVRLSESVGIVKWNNNGNEGSASCFYLGDCYILTCYHVAEMVVGNGVAEGEWGNIIQKSTQISFTHKDEYLSNGWSKVEPWFEVYCKDLDYALLKMEVADGQGKDLPPAVSATAPTLPQNGVVYIVGHPGGMPKCTDTCLIVPFMQREDVCSQGVVLQLFTKDSFRPLKSSKRITYNTCLFHGASGAPIFNFSGELVGMHAGGYPYTIGHNSSSLIEFGPTIEAIDEHMKKHHPRLDWSLRTAPKQTQGDRNMPSDEQVPMDIE